MPREFNKSIMTDNGAMLLNRAQAGEVLLEFTRMVIGDGTYTLEEASTEVMQKMENLKSPRKSYPIIEKSLEKKRCLKLTSVFYNYTPGNEEAYVEEGFFVNEIGLFCREKNNEESEILYSIVTVKDGPGDYMPAYNGENRAEILQTWYTTITNDGIAYIKHEDGTFALAENVEKLAERIESIIESIFDEENELNISESIIDFDDSGEVEGIESFTDFMEKLVKGTSIYQIFTNLKAGLKYVLHTGKLVNSGMCETPGEFALDAAYGKYLTDQISQVYSEMSVRYNAQTDYIQVYSGQQWHNWMTAGLLWDGYLYNYGKFSEYFSGFSGNGNVYHKADHISVIAGPVTGTNLVTVKSNQIDFSKYKKIKINAKSSVYTAGAYYTNIYIESKSGNIVTGKKTLSTAATTYELDVTGVDVGYIVLQSYLYNITLNFENFIYFIQIN